MLYSHLQQQHKLYEVVLDRMSREVAVLKLDVEDTISMIDDILPQTASSAEAAA